jgi:hypothetical protein
MYKHETNQNMPRLGAPLIADHHQEVVSCPWSDCTTLHENQQIESKN